jgi:hypothetical protein
MKEHILGFLTILLAFVLPPVVFFEEFLHTSEFVYIWMGIFFFIGIFFGFASD